MSNYRRVFENGYCYFLTIVTHKRIPILIDNINLLRKSFQLNKIKYDYKIEAIVILPDHFHLLINPKVATDYPNIIKDIKQYFSRHCPDKYYRYVNQSSSRTKEGYKPIWQKKYYEHTIRNNEDYDAKFHYIHYNPVKHRHVTTVKEWQFSSFHSYVKKGFYNIDWSDFNENIDFE